MKFSAFVCLLPYLLEALCAQGRLPFHNTNSSHSGALGIQTLRIKCIGTSFSQSTSICSQKHYQCVESSVTPGFKFLPAAMEGQISSVSS